MKEWDDALEALDRLSRRLADPYLDVERARAYLGKRMPDAAKECAERALAADPTLDRGYLRLLETALLQDDMGAAVAVLERFRLARLRSHVSRERVLAKLVGSRSELDLTKLRAARDYKEWIETPK